MIWTCASGGGNLKAMASNQKPSPEVAKVVILIFATIAIILICACPAVQSHYLAKPERLAVAGAYVHAGSQITLPESIASFHRDGVTRYDSDGRDISAGYNLMTVSHQIAATVYVYPAPPLTSIGSPPEVAAAARAHLTEREFEHRQQEIQRVHPGATLVEQRDAVQFQDGKTYPGRAAVYEFESPFAGSTIPVRSHLYVFCGVDGKWAIEYRFTHPKSENADPEIQAFMEKWAWH
jgi:hypothetical protein